MMEVCWITGVKELLLLTIGEKGGLRVVLKEKTYEANKFFAMKKLYAYKLVRPLQGEEENGQEDL